jgi:rRNA maturation endonuclease Nob1
MKAKHRCLRCFHYWESQPGPTQCPICGHLYVKWLNYEEMREAWNVERRRTGRREI